MTEEENKRILAIFSHADDELSCAGTLANHADAGDDVTLIFLTKGENSTTVEGENDETAKKREKHAKEISDLLGIKIRFMDFPDSRIPYTVENGYKIAEKIKEIRPHILITWNEFTRLGAGHPDHRNTSKLVHDAVNYARYQNKDSDYPPYREVISYYRYHNPQLNRDYELQYVDVTHQEEKIRQFIKIYSEAYGDWPVEDFKFNSLRYHGQSVDVKFAEVFEVVYREPDVPKLLS